MEIFGNGATAARKLIPNGARERETTRDDFEALGGVGSLDDLDGEVPEGGLVHELGAIIGPVGEQMLQPRPTLADAVQDHLGPGAVGDVGGRQIDHQKTAVGVDRDVALATDDLLARVVSPCFRFRSFDRLAVDDAPGWARFASRRALGRASARHRGSSET